MANVIDPTRSPFGLSGGSILSGSTSAACDGFWYYPVTNTTAIVKLGNLSGSVVSASFTAGIGVYGDIYQVTQSTGIAVVYSASAPLIRY